MKSTFPRLLLLTLLSLLGPLALHAATNLVVNGDFSANGAEFISFPGKIGEGENPISIPGWILDTWNGGGAFGINGANGHTPFGPIDKSGIPGYYGYIQGGTHAHFYQDFNLSPDTTYRLEFKSAARYNESTAQGMVNFRNLGLDENLTTLNFHPSNTAFQTYSFDFTTPATITGDTRLWLMLLDSQGTYGDVVLTEIPSLEHVLTYDAPDGNSTVTTNLSGSGGLVKNGAGKLILTGANEYTGPTTVNAGTLALNGSTHPDSAVMIAAGATLQGNGTINGSLTLEAGARLGFNALATLTVNGTQVSFGDFGVADLDGLDSSVRPGVYTLIDGLATIDMTNVSNVGEANAFDLGDGISAYFQAGSLELVVLSEEPVVDTYHWTAAGANTSWETEANWDNPPVFDDYANLVFNVSTLASTHPSFSFLAEHRVARSLTFGEKMTGSTTWDIRFNVGGGGTATAPRNLTLQAHQGNATITINEGYGANNSLTQLRLGNNNGGGASIILGSDLDIHQHSPHAALQLNQTVAETGGEFAINKYGEGEVTMFRNGTYSGGFNLHQGPVNAYAAPTALGSGPVNVGSPDPNHSHHDVLLNFGGGDRTYTNDIVVNVGDGERTIGMHEFGAAAGGGNLAGSITLHKDVTFQTTFLDENFNGLDVSGVISGEGGLIIDGATGTRTVLSGENTYTGTTSVLSGTLALDGAGSINGSSEINIATGATLDASAKTEGLTIAAGTVLGGDGTVAGNLTLGSGAQLAFHPTDTLTVDGAEISFAGFALADIVGLDGSPELGTYTLIDGTATIDWTHISNIGEANAAYIGGGKAAYFQGGSLQLVVIESAIETYEEWADRFNLAGSDRDEGAEQDGDGLTNLEEYLFGTDPTDPTSRFTITAETTEDGISLSFNTVAGRTYQIQRSTDLITWNPIKDAIIGDGNHIQIEDTDSPADRAFYRVLVALQ